MKTKCNWEKRIIHNFEAFKRYEIVCDKKYTIDVSMFKEQGFLGSNQVNVFRGDYGGWILNTPKSFSTKKEVNDFIKSAKKKLEKGEYGKQVPFPL